MVLSELVCVAGIFLFSNSWRGGLSPFETFLGEIIGLCCRTGLSAVFSSCCVAVLQACETRCVGPPSRLAVAGLFWAIFQTGYSPQRALQSREGLRFLDFLDW